MRIDKNILARKIVDKTVEVMQKLGFDEDGALAYSDFDIYEDDGRVVVEVRAEMDYDGMDALANALNPIVQDFDEDAYFDHEAFGVITAYIGEHAVHLEERFKTLDKQLFNRFDEAFELEALYESVEKNLTEAQKRRINEFIEMPEMTADDVRAFIIDIQPEEEVALVSDFDACPSAYVDFDNCDSCMITEIPNMFNCGDILVSDSALDLRDGITIPAGKTFVLIDADGICDCPEIKFNDTYYDLDVADCVARFAKTNALEDILADENVDMFFTDIEVPVITEKLNESVKTTKPEKKTNLRESLKKRDSRDFRENNKTLELESLYESLKSGFSDEDVKEIVEFEADPKHDSEDVAKFMQDKLDEALAPEEVKGLVKEVNDILRDTGFELDRSINHANPVKGYFGDSYHWQVIEPKTQIDPEDPSVQEKIRMVATPLIAALDEFDKKYEGNAYSTWNFGLNKDGFVTCGFDVRWLNAKEEEIKEEVLQENIKFSNDEIKANLSDEAFKVWRALEKDGATLTNNSEHGILYRDDEGHEENYPKWSDFEDDLIFTGKTWKEWDFNPIDELDESLDHRYIDISEINSHRFPNLYEALNIGALSLIAIDNKVLYNEKFSTSEMEAENIDYKEVINEIKIFADEHDLKFNLDLNYTESLEEDFWNPSKWFKRYQEFEDYSAEAWNSWDDQTRDEVVEEQVEDFLSTFLDEITASDIKELYDDMVDNNYHRDARILLDKAEDLFPDKKIVAYRVLQGDYDTHYEEKEFDNIEDAEKFVDEMNKKETIYRWYI